MSSTDIKTAATTKGTEKLRDSGGRVSQFSYIRVIACFAIVLLHSFNNSRVYHAETISDGQTTLAFAVCAALMWAVPCFLMVSGALLLDSSRVITPAKLFGKYISRMVIALVVFTAIFTLIKHDPANGTGIVKEFFDGLLFNHCMSYLWYLYAMIVIYLLLPLFRKAAGSLTDRQLWTGIAVLLVIFSLLPLTVYAGVDAALYIPTWVIYGIYPFLGYLLYRHRPDARVSAAVFVICSIALPLAVYLLAPTEYDSAGLTGYNSPLVVLQSAAAYSLMLGIKRDAGKTLLSIDRCTFGIYLIHMIFVRLTMKELGLNLFDYGPAAFVAAAAVYFAAAFAVTYLLKKFRIFSFL